MNEQQKTELEPEVVDLINAGSKIEAIKMLRELRNIGLKESKEIVDQYEADGTTGVERSTDDGESTHEGIKRPSNSSNKVIFMAIVLCVAFVLYRQFT